MKVISRKLLPFQEKEFILPIRDKIDYVRLILYSARLLLLKYDTGSVAVTCSLKVLVSKMSRLFVYKDAKFFSVSFPFNIINNGNDVEEISTYSGNKVDNQVISSAISILNNDQFKLKPSPMDFWIETDSSEIAGLYLLEEIFLFEPGYIRYDIDPERIKGKLHPLHHLDVNYSSYGTYKLGLNDKIVDSYFENILNISTDCSFIAD